MRKVYSVALILAMGMLLAACSEKQPPAANSYSRGTKPPALTKATDTASWGLYATGGLTPIYGPVTLKTGDEFGFKYNAAGKVVGYVAGQEIPLENWLASTYSWQKIPPPKK